MTDAATPAPTQATFTAASQLVQTPATTGTTVAPAPSDPVEGPPMVEEPTEATAPSETPGETGASDTHSSPEPDTAPSAAEPSVDETAPVTPPSTTTQLVIPSGLPSDTREAAAQEAAGTRQAISNTIAPHLSALEHLAAAAEQVLADIHSAIANLRDQHPA